MTPDVNVLVAAFRIDHSQHAPARAWLDSALTACHRGQLRLVVLSAVLASFLRLVTNRRVFARISSVDAAVGFTDALLAWPHAEMEGGPAWLGFRARVLRLGLQGDQIPDAWIAAQVEALGEHLVTFDRDFLRLLPARDVTLLA